MAETKTNPSFGEDAVADIEHECETWDWARTAGVSAADLRKALSDSEPVSARSGARPD